MSACYHCISAPGMTNYPIGQVSRHFGPRTFWHYQTGAEVSGQFGTSAEVSRHFGTGAEQCAHHHFFFFLLRPIPSDVQLFIQASFDCRGRFEWYGN